MEEKKEPTITFTLNYDEWFCMVIAIKSCQKFFGWNGKHFLAKGTESLIKKINETRFEK